MSALGWLARVLDAEFACERVSDSALTPFQQLGLAAVERALDLYGGALLADEVGLGKTHVAVSLLKHRGGGLVCAPAGLLPMWRRRVAEAGASGVSFCSHALLARGQFDLEDAPQGVVVVDEAHGFVNPQARRSQAVAALAMRRPVLLLTATPVGISAGDLGRLLRLFVPHGALMPLLGASLEDFLAKPGADLSLLWRSVVIRRPRWLIQQAWPSGVEVLGSDGRPKRLGFPVRRDVRLAWEMDNGTAAALERLVDGVTGFDEASLGICGGLLGALLLARLESSPEAVDVSLARLEGFVRRRLEALAKGRDLDRRAWRRCFGAMVAEEDRQQVMAFMFDPALQPGQGPLSAALGGQLAQIQRLRQAVEVWRRADPKFAALVRWCESEPGQGTAVIFTRFADTARALHHKLQARWPIDEVGLVTSGHGRVGALKVGVAGVLEALEAGRLRVLVATDVLAEGFNLQSCASVISHDLPWNPRRLVQRFGRVDRLGRPGRQVNAVLMVPEARFERWLGQVERLGARAEVMERMLGQRLHTAGWLRGVLRGEVEVESEAAMEADLGLRLAWWRLEGARRADGGPLGWRVRATPRQPPGVLFVVSLGLPGAAPRWCFVPQQAGAPLVVRRGALVEGVLALPRRRREPLMVPPAMALRRALEDAWWHRQRLRAARLGPPAHPPGSAAARLLRHLAALPPPRPHETAVVSRREALRRALAVPLPAHLACAVDGALRGGEPLEAFEAILKGHGVEAKRGEEGGELEVLGFVVFAAEPS